MLYKKYQLYDNKIEIMIPSEYSYNEDVFALSENTWKSKDRTISIDVNLALISPNKRDAELSKRLQEYYLNYKSSLEKFECEKVIKRKIYNKDYGEIDYQSGVMGYDFYNSQLITIIDGKELTLSIQCLYEKKKELEHIFNIIKESVKIVKEEV